MSSPDHILRARLMVVDYYNFYLPDDKKISSNLADRRGQGYEIADVPKTIEIDDVYVVQFTYILGGWKANLSTVVPDDRYYEVTHKPDHDGSDGPMKTFLDSWKKEANVEYPSEHPVHSV